MNRTPRGRDGASLCATCLLLGSLALFPPGLDAATGREAAGLAGEVDAMVHELLRDPDTQRRIKAAGGRVMFEGLAWESSPGRLAGTSPLGLELESAVNQALSRRGITVGQPALRTRGIAGALLKGAFGVVGTSARAVLSMVDINSGKVVAEAKRALRPSSVLDFGMDQLLPPGADNARLLAQLVHGTLGTGPQPFPIAVRTVRGAHAAYFEGERLQVLVETERDCHLRLYHISWAEKRLTMIFPNRSEPNGFVTAGSAIRVPADGSDAVFEVARPYGVDAIVAIGSEAPFTDEAVVQARLAASDVLEGGPPSETSSVSSEPPASSGLSAPTESPASEPAPAGDAQGELQRTGEFITESGIDETRTRGVLTRGLIVRHRVTGSGAASGAALTSPLGLEGQGGSGRISRAVCYFTTLPRISLSR